MSGGLKIGFLTTVGVVSLLMTACTSTGTSEKTAASTGTPEQTASSTDTVEQTASSTETVEQTASTTETADQEFDDYVDKIMGRQEYEPEELRIFCPFCHSFNVKESNRYFTRETKEPQICVRDNLSFETVVVLVSTDCTCLDCEESWVQEQEYSLCYCPIHGMISSGYGAYAQTEQSEQAEQSETEQ